MLILILGLEYTFDDLSISLVQNGRKVIFLKTINTSEKLYEKFGGVIPKENAIIGKKNINNLIEYAISELSFIWNIDFISYSAMPGMPSSLRIIKDLAINLSKQLDKLCLGVNHLEAHFFSVYIDKNIKEFEKVLYLIISGGNTKLYIITNHQFKCIDETKDISIGDMLDKIARKLNFKHAKHMDQFMTNHIEIKLPKIKFKYENNTNFSFSGLQTFFFKWIEETSNKLDRFTQASSIFISTFKYLIEKINISRLKYNINDIVIGGGVAASNHFKKLIFFDNNIFLTSTEYQTDNAAMIASAAYFGIINSNDS
jgi:N6-L-threonylcarbamoyladenine synthase